MDAISSALEHVRRSLPEIAGRSGVPMSEHTSFRIGGPARGMFFPAVAEELISLCGSLHERGVSPYIIGNGTNLLFDDKPLDIVVIKTAKLCAIRRTGEAEITAQCGASMSKIAVFACNNGLSGLEFAQGIPGALGGAVSMNAGAYGGEMKDIVVETKAYDTERGVFSSEGAQQGFSYRKSRFFDTGEIILSSVMKLKKESTDSISLRMAELSARRSESQPLDLPSAGSTFKRPAEGYAASLIEESGLKGFAVGGAQVSKKHSGFIVNRGGASFSDVMAVIEHVRETVFKRTGVRLEPEIKIIRG